MQYNVNKKKIKLVIFDLDGTLVDTLDDITDSANKILKRFDIPEATKEQVKYAVGSGVINFFVSLTNKKIDIKKARLQYTKQYLKNLSKKSRIYPGMLNVLKELKRREISLYVVSNKPQIFTSKLLKELKIEKYFKEIIGINSEEKKRLKQSPYYLKRILLKEKINPKNALIIGDSKTDILSAKNTKMYSCAVLYGFRKYEELKKYRPNYYIRKPMDILKIIK
jgi:phosphoglycolate phosphatase